MKTKYDKDQKSYYQTIQTEIAAETETVFEYLGTTNGISKWFPELSFNKNHSTHTLIFDLGNGSYEEMNVISYQNPRHIKFTWDIGTVEFKLEPDGDKTLLTFHEALPHEFGHISKDFTGWYFQMVNVKHLIENGETKPMDMTLFKNQEKELQIKLKYLEIS